MTELVEKLETLAEKIEGDPEWFADMSLDDGDLVDMLRSAIDGLQLLERVPRQPLPNALRLDVDAFFFGD